MKLRITTRDVAQIGVMIATIEAAKMALSVIPGVEIVTLLIILYSLTFGKKIYYVLAAFVLIEGCLYGFGVWWIMYLYIWPLLAFLTQMFWKNESVILWSVFSGVYGLCFGALCSIPYYFVGGAKMAVTWWVSGIPTDIAHGISNFILCLILFKPLKNALEKLSR